MLPKGSGMIKSTCIHIFTSSSSLALSSQSSYAEQITPSVTAKNSGRDLSEDSLAVPPEPHAFSADMVGTKQQAGA